MPVCVGVEGCTCKCGTGFIIITSEHQMGRGGAGGEGKYDGRRGAPWMMTGPQPVLPNFSQSPLDPICCHMRLMCTIWVSLKKGGYTGGCFPEQSSVHIPGASALLFLVQDLD